MTGFDEQDEIFFVDGVKALEHRLDKCIAVELIEVMLKSCKTILIILFCSCVFFITCGSTLVLLSCIQRCMDWSTG